MLGKMLKKFIREETAASSLESVIMMPVLAWTFVGSFVFFDAFRTYNSSIKASFTIADYISRQTATVYGHDIQGMATVFNELVRNNNDVRIRVSQILHNDGVYTVEWSDTTGGEARLFNNTLQPLIPQLPIMGSPDRLILVETTIPYRPAIDLGLDVVEFSNFTFTRPRAGQVAHNPSDVLPQTVIDERRARQEVAAGGEPTG